MTVKKFAIFDVDGFPKAFYTDDIHPVETIPAEAIEITTQQWLAFIDNQGRRRWKDGHVVPYDPPEPEPTVPEVVTMRQAKIQLSRVGMLKQVDDAIAAMEGQPGEEARIEWVAASELRRDHYLVAALGNVLGLDNKALDGLFMEAAKI